MSIIKVADFEIKLSDPRDNMQKYAPQVLNPKKSINFFLQHPHYFVAFNELHLLMVSSVGGQTELLYQIEPKLEELTQVLTYGWKDLIGIFIQRIAPYLQSIQEQVTSISGNEDEIKVEIAQHVSTFMQNPKNLFQIVGELPLPMLCLSQKSIPAILSKYILDNYRRYCNGINSKSNLEDYKKIDDSLFYLYNAKVLYPMFSTSICTNRFEPHLDFIFSDRPLREGTCRYCNAPLIVFNHYIVAEPYARLKSEQKDISYLIASYLSIVTSRALECYPEILIKDLREEEQVDVFIRNWENGLTAILECKIRENSDSTIETKKNIIKTDVIQLKRKMKNLAVNYGYLVTNLVFNTKEEKDKLEKDYFKINSNKKKIYLIARVGNENLLECMNKIINDLGAREDSTS
jgi:hypothetical protein